MENPLLELQEYENLLQAVQEGKGPFQASGCLDSQKVHLMYELGKGGGFSWTLAVTYDEQRAKEIYDDFRNFTKNVWLYPAKDLLFYSADIHGNLMTRQRIAVLRRLMEEKEGTSCDPTPEEMAQLLYNRNTDWVAKMPAIMQAAPTLFVVGAGHLPGNKGVLSLLKQQGYQVEPME